MAKSENKLARLAYKSAIVDCLERIHTLNTAGDVGVTFWCIELQGVLGRQIGKLAGVELPAVKHGKVNGEPTCRAALATVTAERDALAARLASLGRGERAKVREARSEAGEAWERLGSVTVYDSDAVNPDPEEPDFDDCHITGEFEAVCYAD